MHVDWQTVVLVYRVNGSTEWIQHGTALADLPECDLDNKASTDQIDHDL